MNMIIRFITIVMFNLLFKNSKTKRSVLEDSNLDSVTNKFINNGKAV
jgi:hypothetical protein